MRPVHPLMALLVMLALASVLAQDGSVARADTLAHDELPDDRVLYVAPGQSLVQLVQRLYPDQPARWNEIRGWIVENNPHAFVDGDPARLRADVRVKLPTPSAFATTDPYDLAAAGASADDADGDRAPLSFGRRFVFVDPAQSLAELVPRLYPQDREHWGDIIDAIVARNAERLADLQAEGEIARGTRLQIPTVAVAPATGESGQPGTAETEERPPAPIVARVMARTGDVYATGRSGEERSLDTGDPVRRGDILRTGTEASAELRFRDHERVFLRPETRMRVRAWHLPETGPGTRVIELFEGAMRAITGAIGNRAEDTYRTITPQATLGVRGTEYALRLCERGDCRVPEDDGGVLPRGLYLGVDVGRVVLLNEASETVVPAGEYRYVAGPGTEPVPTGAGVARVLYTEAEQLERAPSTATDEPQAAAEDEGSSWWWGVLGVVLLGVAL